MIGKARGKITDATVDFEGPRPLWTLVVMPRAAVLEFVRPRTSDVGTYTVVAYFPTQWMASVAFRILLRVRRGSTRYTEAWLCVTTIESATVVRGGDNGA